MIHDREDGITNLRSGEAPAYLIAGDGLFLVRSSLLGTGMVKLHQYPNWLKNTGKPNGTYEYDAPIVPAELTAQIQDFFQRIYERQHTEAAVLLLMHEETKQWRVFVPTQLVNHGGVNYVYDRSHISKGWLVVGTMHSHCDFGAYHSSTDTGDADGMDGVHFTIGRNLRTKTDADGVITRDPEIACMVAMNKKRWDFTPSEMCDTSELGQHEAPAWWDQYVGGKDKDSPNPVGFELYKKLGQDTLIKTERKYVDPKLTVLKPLGSVSPGVSGPGSSLVPWGAGASKPYQPYAGGQPYTKTVDELTERYQRTQKYYDELTEEWHELDKHQPNWDEPDGQQNREFLRAHGWEMDAKTGRWIGPGQPRGSEQMFSLERGITNESRDFNARQAAAHGVKWNSEGGVEVSSTDTRDIPGLGIAEYWEDDMEKAFLTTLFGTEMMTDDDVDWATSHMQEALQPEEWAARWAERIIEASAFIAANSNYRINVRKVKQTAPSPMKGTHI